MVSTHIDSLKTLIFQSYSLLEKMIDIPEYKGDKTNFCALKNTLSLSPFNESKAFTDLLTTLLYIEEKPMPDLYPFLFSMIYLKQNENKIYQRLLLKTANKILSKSEDECSVIIGYCIEMNQALALDKKAAKNSSIPAIQQNDLQEKVNSLLETYESKAEASKSDQKAKSQRGKQKDDEEGKKGDELDSVGQKGNSDLKDFSVELKTQEKSEDYQRLLSMVSHIQQENDNLKKEIKSFKEQTSKAINSFKEKTSDFASNKETNKIFWCTVMNTFNEMRNEIQASKTECISFAQKVNTNADTKITKAIQTKEAKEKYQEQLFYFLSSLLLTLQDHLRLLPFRSFAQAIFTQFQEKYHLDFKSYDQLTSSILDKVNKEDIPELETVLLYCKTIIHCTNFFVHQGDEEVFDLEFDYNKGVDGETKKYVPDTLEDFLAYLGKGSMIQILVSLTKRNYSFISNEQLKKLTKSIQNPPIDELIRVFKRLTFNSQNSMNFKAFIQSAGKVEQS